MQLAVHQFTGEDGLKAMSSETVRASSAPGRFAATLTRAQVGLLVIDELRATPFVARRSAQHVRADRVDTIQLVFVVAGAIRVRQDEREAIVAVGEAMVLRTNAPFEYSVSAAYTCVSLTVPRSRLPASTAAQLRFATACIHSGLMVSSMLGFLRTCLESGAFADESPAAEEAAIIALTEVFLTSSGVSRSPTEDELVVEKAQAIIRHNVRSSGLGAASISAELGISSRSLYRSFRASGTGIADEIRLLRLHMIADELMLGSRRPSMELLARQHGFRSADVCGRVFKAHYGQPMGAYRRSHRRGHGRLKTR
ncbi:MAG: transcriptional regulator, AraC family [Subtercola sp.]|nr:transcriptional regulator, AraC family [Subtercola sp.]